MAVNINNLRRASKKRKLFRETECKRCTTNIPSGEFVFYVSAYGNLDWKGTYHEGCWIDLYKEISIR